MRAYRPSAFGSSDVVEEDEDEKQMLIRIYASRVKQGLPIFEEKVQKSSSSSKG